MHSLTSLLLNSRALSRLVVSGAAATAAMAAATAHANLLTNPGYEVSAITTANNVLNNFSGFQGVWGPELGTITGATGGVTPFAGAQMHRLANAGGVATQTFQAVDVSSFSALINAGNAQITASAFFNTVGGYAGAQSSVVVRFFSGATYSSLIGNSGAGGLNLDANPLSWESASVTSMVPVNTTWVVFQGAYGNASIGNNPGFIDNAFMDITAVPAPGALALLGLAGIVGRRRR